MRTQDRTGGDKPRSYTQRSSVIARSVATKQSNVASANGVVLATLDRFVASLLAMTGWGARGRGTRPW